MTAQSLLWYRYQYQTVPFVVLVVLLFVSWLKSSGVTALSSSYRSNNAFGQTQRVVPRSKKPGNAPVAVGAKAPNAKKKKDKTPSPSPDDPTVVAFIRLEYDVWVMQHNKTADEDRFLVFKKNFLATLETFETTGKYHALNRFADLTPEEYKLELKEEEAEMDAYVRSEYRAWREQYNKSPDEARYKVFKDNFLMTMKIFEDTGKFNALNEHGDMTREDFLKMQTHLAISSSRREGAGAGAGGSGGGQGWNSNPYNMQQQSQAASYQRSEAMTFQPVTPRSTSDVLNSRGTSGTEYDIAYGIGGGSRGGRETVDNSWGGGGGGGGSMGDPWGGGGMGMGMGGASAYGQSPIYSPSPSPSAPTFQRTDAMTFAPVSPRSTSDVLNNGGNRGGGGGLGSEWDIAYGRTSGGGGGSMGSGNRPDWNQAAYSNGGGNSYGNGGNSWGGRQESVAPMVGPPSNYPSSGRSDPYGGGSSGGGNTYQYERPSEMTFTPVTPRSSSDVLNNNGGGRRETSDWDIAYGYNRRGGSSGALGATATWSPTPTPPQATSPSQPYKPSNPPGANFVPISPNSESDMRNRRRDDSSTFSYVAQSPESQNEARNGINSFMGSGQSNPPDVRGRNSNDSIWNKMASAVDTLVGGSKPPPSRSSNDNDFFSYLKQNSPNTRPDGPG